MRQENELLWVAGNPNRRNEYLASASLTYTYLFNKILSLSAVAQYRGEFHELTPTYLNGGDFIIQSFSADGRRQNLYFTLNVPIKLFNGKLSLTPNVSHSSYWQRGPIAGNVSYIDYGLNANGFCGDWSFSGYFHSPSKYINFLGFQKSPCQYGVSVSWFKGNLSISASAHDWFKTNNGPVFWYDCDLYSTRRETLWRSSYGRGFNIRVGYTLDFGKKVERGDEVQAGSGISTSIM